MSVIDLISEPEAFEAGKEITKKLEKFGNDDAIRILAGLLSDRMIEVLKGLGKYKPSAFTKDLIGKNGVAEMDCVDHHGVMTLEDQKIQFIEPYGLSFDDLKDIIRFCEEKNLRAAVEAFSPHFPGRTLMVQFYQKKT